MRPRYIGCCLKEALNKYSRPGIFKTTGEKVNDWRHLFRIGLVWLMVLAPLMPAAARTDTWLLIDTSAATAEVKRGGETVLRLPNLSFGRGGVAALHLYGDKTTPLGEFHITRVDRDTNYHVFLGLNYPTLEHLDAAYRTGVIDQATYSWALDFALARGHMPQRTVLGGHIGIHGLGRADLDIHQRFNWTQGCVAMTDSQIDQLLHFVTVGTSVVIR